MELEDFQQEYELSFNDESQTYFPYDLIFSCCQDDLETYSSIAKLVSGTKSDLFAGFDVGRTRNTSELIILERKPKRLIYRLGRSFDRSRFQVQEAFLREMMKSSPRFRRLCIDRHGIGMNLAENHRTEIKSRFEWIALVGQVMEFPSGNWAEDSLRTRGCIYPKGTGVDQTD